MDDEARRVLIYRLGSLGDTVVALPALHLVARAFPDAERRLLTNFPVNVKAPAAAAVLGASGLVHGYFRYSVGSRSLLELLRLWWALVWWRPNVLVYLGAARGTDSARRDAWFFRACGVSRQIGVPLTPEMQANLPLDTEGVLEPECNRLVRNLSTLGAITIEDPSSWDLKLTAAERFAADQVLLPACGRPLLAVSVGTKVQAKDWGGENWKALLTALGKLYPTYALALLGAPEESEVSDFVAGGWRESAEQGSPVINLCGRLTPRESAACLALSHLFLGHDSGPMHLAAAVQTPCVAIFAARNLPRVWYPFGPHHRVIYHAVACAGCQLEVCEVERKRCLTSIRVAEVLAAVRQVLDHGSQVDARLLSSRNT